MAFSHILPAHTFSKLTPEVIRQAIDKTVGGVKYAVLDKRMQGKAEEREPVLNALEELRIEVKKLK